MYTYLIASLGKSISVDVYLAVSFGWMQGKSSFVLL